MNPSVKASIKDHALSMEQLHTYERCDRHLGCCVIASGPYIDNGLIPRGTGLDHVIARTGAYDASEDAARKLVRRYATGKMEREYRARSSTQ